MLKKMSLLLVIKSSSQLSSICNEILIKDSELLNVYIWLIVAWLQKKASNKIKFNIKKMFFIDYAKLQNYFLVWLNKYD